MTRIMRTTTIEYLMFHGRYVGVATGSEAGSTLRPDKDDRFYMP
jgi:hypothetical protein